MVTEVKKKTQNENKGSLKEGMVKYFKGVKTEWRKITWPERGQVFAETVVVLGVVFFFTVLVYVMDILFKYLFITMSKWVG